MKICLQILENIFYLFNQVANAKNLFTVTSSKRIAPVFHEFHQSVLLSYSSFYGPTYISLLANSTPFLSGDLASMRISVNYKREGTFVLDIHEPRAES